MGVCEGDYHLINIHTSPDTLNLQLASEPEGPPKSTIDDSILPDRISTL